MKPPPDLWPLPLDLSGITLPSLTSCLYFLVFLGLVWWWVFHRSLSLLLFSTLCVMLALFSAGHLLILYLYQLPLAQAVVPPHDVYARWAVENQSLYLYYYYYFFFLSKAT